MREPRGIVGPQVLHVFDTKAPVGWTVLPFGALEQVENCVNRAVTNCVYRDLQTRLIGRLNTGVVPRAESVRSALAKPL